MMSRAHGNKIIADGVLGRCDARSSGVSVIIPTLNEQEIIAGTIRELRTQQPGEIIVVDGGSTDRTCAEAAGADLVLRSAPGRALQMNLGAAHARGDTLLFLHADCTLEPGALEEVEHILGARGVVAGCFRMRVRSPGLLYRSIDFCATARVRLTGIAYGDQGLFLRTEQFRRLGGFPPLTFMEDVFFSKALRRQGAIAVARSRVYVSERRWRQVGTVRQTLRNWTLTALVLGGMAPDRLGRFYPAVR
jgi:rSAM/selenodomain-associated transferase 2